MRAIARILALALGTYIGLWSVAGDRTDAIEKPVDLTVRPTIVIARLNTLRAEIHVPRDTDNRALYLQWTSDTGPTGKSYWQLDGDKSEAIFVRELPDMPAANYLFVATLVGAANEIRGTARGEVHRPDPDGGGAR